MGSKEHTLPHDSPDHALHPGLTNRYKIIRLLGSGGMGNVYLAQDKELNRFVAVKTIKPDLTQDAHVRKRIDIECRLHAAIGMHPNIVALHDRIELDGFVYLILEFVEGVLLSELLESENSSLASAGLAKKIEIILQILEGLQAIHKRNILHRDIKPSNVMVSNLNSGRLSVKLMDFGIAHAESEEIALTRLTAVDSSGPGTPTYMAPERIDPQTFGAISVATDLYSVGVILFQMLSDGPPFRGTVTEILMGHLTKPIDLSTLKKDLPIKLQKVLFRSLQKKQTDRHSDAGAFADSLRDALATFRGESSTANDGLSEQTLLATDPKLLMLQESRTLLNTKASVELSPKAKWRRRVLATGTALVLLIAVSLLLWQYSGVFSKRQAVDQVSPSIITESKTVGPSTGNILQEKESSHISVAKPEEDGSENGEEKAASPGHSDSAVVHSNAVDTPGNNPQEQEAVGQPEKKQVSAMDAFNSARTVKIQENSAETIQNAPSKTNNESRSVGLPQISSRKANESAIKPKCENLRKNWQLLGDSSSMQQFRQECAN